MLFSIDELIYITKCNTHTNPKTMPLCHQRYDRVALLYHHSRSFTAPRVYQEQQQALFFALTIVDIIAFRGGQYRLEVGQAILNQYIIPL